MEKQKRLFFRLLSNMVHSEKDKRIVGLIDNSNMETLHAIAVVATIAEVFSLLAFLITKGSSPSSPAFLTGILSVSFCIVAVSIIALLTKILTNGYKKTGSISHLKVTLLIILFYTVLSLWGINVDIRHYKLSEQMLTFYIVQFCFLNFLMIVPIYGNFLILAMFGLLYFRALSIDGAKFLQPNNHFVFAAIAVFANTIQYSRAIEKNKDKLGIFELNLVLKQRSITDDLTKLKNRYALREEFSKFIGHKIYIIMSDIDYFKKVNDSYGHLVGDELLQKISKTLNEVFYDGDIYRYGGDEFLIVLTDCSQDEYEDKMKAWEVALSNVKLDGVEMKFACSSGYSCGVPETNDDYRKLLKEADDKLYKVKKSREDFLPW